MKPYIFRDATEEEEYRRLVMIEEVFDPLSQSILEKMNLRKGGCFLELGPGAGGILARLSEMAGSQGKVIAIDSNTRMMRGQFNLNVEVIEKDITQTDLESKSFDLVHERYVLMHIPSFREVLGKLFKAMKSGGWILLEDADFSSAKMEVGTPEQEKAFNSVSLAIKAMFASKGLAWDFGGHLPAFLSNAGFKDVMSTVYAPPSRGGSGLASIMERSARQLRAAYLGTGHTTAQQIKRYCDFANSSETSAIYYSTVSAWAQKK